MLRGRGGVDQSSTLVRQRFASVIWNNVLVKNVYRGYIMFGYEGVLFEDSRGGALGTPLVGHSTALMAGGFVLRSDQQPGRIFRLIFYEPLETFHHQRPRVGIHCGGESKYIIVPGTLVGHHVCPISLPYLHELVIYDEPTGWEGCSSRNMPN